MEVALSPGLDPAAFAAVFARDGHVQIPEILTAVSAHAIQRLLAEETDYRLLFNTPRGPRALQAEIAKNPEMRQKFLHDLHGDARGNFQFLYDGAPLSDDGGPYRGTHPGLAAVTQFLQGPDFLELARAVTGMPAIATADAQATRYGPGQFLNIHDDSHPGGRRLAAYVLNLTPQWRPDWGGLLLFHGAAGAVTGGYAPAFNALNIFRVPRLHAVSMVAPFAGALRHSITGWLLSP